MATVGLALGTKPSSARARLAEGETVLNQGVGYGPVCTCAAHSAGAARERSRIRQTARCSAAAVLVASRLPPGPGFRLA